MVEKARVLKSEGRIVTLSCGSPACGSCSGHFCNLRDRIFPALNSGNLPVKEGDIVDVFVAPGKAIVSGFIVLIMPLVLFAVAYWVTGRVSGGASDLVRVAFGLVGLACGFGLAYAVNRLRPEKDYPEIIGRLG